MTIDTYAASLMRLNSHSFARMRQDVSISGANAQRIELEIAYSRLLTPEKRWTVDYEDPEIRTVSDEMCVYGGEDISEPFNGPWPDSASLGDDMIITDPDYPYEETEDCGDPACQWCREAFGPVPPELT